MPGFPEKRLIAGSTRGLGERAESPEEVAPEDKELCFLPSEAPRSSGEEQAEPSGRGRSTRAGIGRSLEEV
ncbi:hypothetical protein SKAU_G00162280 [Synaphobranchus kaupii]|uniref:Uncharacterized protein n=1 Tax=Synaphobranchus kaupii TaxID=118154 RepID=A0A9Q1IZI9_SYNKA|nr:hypothetical protein SKAU_G00162280 [Synaphobranchus kaupii]